ncbi:MAG: glucose-6-phosphate dehydrogenase [Acidobacteriota bacterium]
MTEAEGKNADCALVVFGGAGDLTRRLLLPALLNLAAEGRLPEHFALVGFARTDLDDEGFRERLDTAVKEHGRKDLDPALWAALRPRVRWVRGNFDEPEAYERLAKTLSEVHAGPGSGACDLFYLACPPRFFADVATRLGAAGLAREGDGRSRRLVVEKPLGRDLASARELNQHLLEVFDEHQVFRIDHYLGKETVQNILAFRFANGIFEPIWNRRYVDSVQITVSETLGVEGRGDYYDRAGALRDMVPNHLFQVLTLIAMEPPSSLDAGAVRDEKGKVLRSIPTWSREQVSAMAVRAQYRDGRLASGREAPGYVEEPSIDPASRTETYAALRLKIDSWRWAGVPFYLRTGKRLKARRSEVVVRFRRAPLQLFRDTPVSGLASNQLVLRLQPREGIALRFEVKRPGLEMKLGRVDMDFCYSEYFGQTATTGYETLLRDAMRGDATLFQRADNVEEGWRVVQPVLDAWGAARDDAVATYPAGSQGPNEAEALLAREGRHWNPIE